MATCLSQKPCSKTRNINQKQCTACHKAKEPVDPAKLAAAIANGEYVAGPMPTPTATTATTATTIQVTETEVKQTGNRLNIKIEVKTNKIIAVRMKKGMNELYVTSTDSNREAVFVHHEDLEDVARTVTLKFMTPDDQVASTVIEVPAKETTATAPKNDDPETLSLHWVKSAPLGANSFRLIITVCKAGGKGVKATVDLHSSQGITHKLTTDANGFAAWDYSYMVLPGNEVCITAKVDGIADTAKVTLKHPPKALPANAGNNNARARKFFIVALILIITCLLTGFGGPIFNRHQNENEVKVALGNDFKYKAMPNFLNTSSTVTSFSAVTNEKVDENPSTLPGEPKTSLRFLWLIALLWTIFAIVYGITAQREEVNYILKLWAFEAFTKRSANANDPMLEYLGNWLGTFSTVKQKNATVVIQNSNEKTKESEDVSFFDLLKSDIAGEFIVEALPKILKKIFWR